MAIRRTAAYGTWSSPITSELVVAGSIGLSEVQWLGDEIYWLETRPQEGGRGTIVCADANGRRRDCLPAPFNARSRVHEYGGGAYLTTVHGIFFSNDADRCIYVLDADATPRRLTEPGAVRYADLAYDAVRRQLIAVCEQAAEPEPRNTLIRVSTDSGEVQPLAAGHDFYSSPCIDPMGETLAWLSWNHPNMPWDGTELWTARIDDAGTLRDLQHIAGGDAESVFQPQFAPDGRLYFVSDRDGWWNLYRWTNGRIENVLPMTAEFGVPQWVFGLSTYAFASADEIVAACVQDGRGQLGVIDLRRPRFARIAEHYTDFGYVRARDGEVAFVGGAPALAPSVVRLHLESGRSSVLRSALDASLIEGSLAPAEPVRFRTAGEEHAYGFYYPPTNVAFRGPPGDKPPLIVTGHGGPSSAARTALNLKLQYWTSRGFAVLDVNYRGSTGFGRPYRERLNGAWGVADVEDCVYGARDLVVAGKADPERLIIRGGSAGGFTTLCALVLYHDFRAAAVYYGVSDLELLARDTHKFEARYLDRLVGPYPMARDVYKRRSPIHYAEKLSTPTIFFQGLDDAVVPPSQTERMVEALKRRGIPCAYLAFEGEGHGFRTATTLQRALEAELAFYAEVFGFAPADALPPIDIHNLNASVNH